MNLTVNLDSLNDSSLNSYNLGDGMKTGGGIPFYGAWVQVLRTNKKSRKFANIWQVSKAQDVL